MEKSSLSEEIAQIDRRLKTVERHIWFNSIIGTLRFLLILAPIVLAVIYVPPFLRTYWPAVEKIFSTVRINLPTLR